MTTPLLVLSGLLIEKMQQANAIIEKYAPGDEIFVPLPTDEFLKVKALNAEMHVITEQIKALSK